MTILQTLLNNTNIISAAEVPGAPKLIRSITGEAVVRKFLSTASVLPESKILIWNMSFRRKGKDDISFVNTIMSDEAITLKDYECIFSDCGRINNLPVDKLSFEEAGFTYVLSQKTGCNLKHVYSKLIFDLLEELAENNAAITLVVKSSGKPLPNDNIHSAILIHIPEKMTIRLKALFASILGGVVFEEIQSMPHEEEDAKNLFSKTQSRFIENSFSRIVAIMYARLSNDIFKYDNSNIDEDDLDDNLDDDLEDELDDELDDKLDDENEDDKTETSIDELELSVRAYNCLKRAGIHTIEKLAKLEQSELESIRNLGKKGLDEVKEKLADWNQKQKGKGACANEKEINYMKKLDELVRIEDVKAQGKKIAAFVKMQNDMRNSGIGTLPNF